MDFMKHKSKAHKAISHKIREVMKKGVRGRKVSRKQAIAIGYSTARKKGYKI